MNFTDHLEVSKGLLRESLNITRDEQLDKALYGRLIQQRISSSCTNFLSPSSRKSKTLLQSVTREDLRRQLQPDSLGNSKIVEGLETLGSKVKIFLQRNKLLSIFFRSSMK